MPVALEEVRSLRHALHRHPETAGEETETAARIQDWLADHAGLDPVASGVGGEGLLYRVEGERDGPTRLLRADLDGLPLQEASDTPYASKVDGRHHACGHDGHMAMLSAALAGLAQDGSAAGTVYGFFQPAEETGEGMAKSLEDERLADLDVDQCFAIHNVPGFPKGHIVVRDGVAAVASTGLRFRFDGRTSHAAEPHEGRNPIPVAARLVPELLASPGDRAGAVAAIVGIDGGGERYGTSAGDAALYATLRADQDDDLAAMVDGVQDTARRLATEAEVTVEADLVEPFPTTHNDPQAVQAVREAAGTAGLPVHAPERPFPWSEDFGHATAHWPGALLGLGLGEDHPAVHHPSYDFDDERLKDGIRFWRALAEAGP